MITEAFICLPIRRDWDTICNLVISLISGGSVLYGAFKYNKDAIVVYLTVEIIHIVVLLIGGVAVFVEVSHSWGCFLSTTDSSFHNCGVYQIQKGEMDFLGAAYFTFCFVNIAFWICVFRLYRRFKNYESPDSERN